MVQVDQQKKCIKPLDSKLPINTHNHIDYGGDDTEHSDYPRSKVRKPCEIEMRRTMYSGD